MKPVNRIKKSVKKTSSNGSTASAVKTTATKTATVTIAAPVKTETVAVKPVTPKPAPVKTAKPTAMPTTIEAKIDVGFGNSLFVRGQGAGLSWDHGTPLTNVDSQTWRLTVSAADKMQIKFLINDSLWAQGEDVVVTPGKSVQLTPAF